MTMEDGDNEQRTHSIGQHPQQRTTEPLRKSAQSKQQRISGKQTGSSNYDTAVRLHCNSD